MMMYRSACATLERSPTSLPKGATTISPLGRRHRLPRRLRLQEHTSRRHITASATSPSLVLVLLSAICVCWCASPMPPVATATLVGVEDCDSNDEPSSTSGGDSCTERRRRDAARRIVRALIPLADVNGDGSLPLGDDDGGAATDLKLSDVLGDVELIFGELIPGGLDPGGGNSKDDGAPTVASDTSTIPSKRFDGDRDAHGGRYADRFVLGMEDILNDEECMGGSIDASSPTFDVKADAVRVFSKCRLLHLRNVFPPQTLERYKLDVTAYLMGIESGRISESGVTSFAGENFYFAENHKKRFDVCFTRDLIDEEIMANKILMGILKDELVLHDEVSMLDFGVILSEPGAPLQNWHRDGGEYLFERSFNVSGVGGHDLPPFAVGVLIPLLNMTASHGPTEFCMGYSNLVGVDNLEAETTAFRNATLRDELDNYEAYMTWDACPSRCWRRPMLDFGDMLLFDYNVYHRGGENSSPDLRTVIYNTYARSWYKDPNFSQDHKASHFKKPDEEHGEKYAHLSETMKELIRGARIAIPDEVKPEDPEHRASLGPDSLEKMGQFRPSHYERLFEPPKTGEDQMEQFILSNIDVDHPAGLRVCTTDEKGVEDCSEFGANSNVFVKAVPGEVLRVRTADGGHFKSFTVVPYQQQIVMSSAVTS